MEEWSSYATSTTARPVGTYSLLVCDVQLWLSIRLQLVLLESCVDPSILHNLLQKFKQKGGGGLKLCATINRFNQAGGCRNLHTLCVISLVITVMVSLPHLICFNLQLINSSLGFYQGQPN